MLWAWRKVKAVAVYERPGLSKAEFFQRLGFASADGGGWQLEFLPE
jgi:hypothetical protein